LSASVTVGGVAERLRLARRSGTAAVSVALIGLLVGSTPTAEASHVNGVKLCERKYGGAQFFSAASDGMHARGGRRVGRVSLNWRPGRQAGYYVQVCAVTIRRTHKRPRFTSVQIHRYDDPAPKWRRDGGRYRVYAGPVVRRIRYSESIRGQARIGKVRCNIHAVLFPPGEPVPSVGTDC
jgi:hypothetical protein